MDAPPSARQQTALHVCALGLLAASAAVASPLWVGLVLSAWFSVLARPLLQRLSRGIGGRRRAAGGLTVLLFLVLLLPLSLAVVSLGIDAVGFARKVLASPDGKNALKVIVSEGGEGVKLPSLRPADLLPLIQQHGNRAFGVLKAVAGVTVSAGLGLFIFLLGCYFFLVDGSRAYEWLEARLPLHRVHFRRLADAFNETGRGLIIGVGLTALIQGVLATVMYLILRLPSALTLGLLTCIAALMPTFGTALVWVPVAAGLALTGRWISALVLAAVGLVVIGSADNVLRPVLARYGRLQMPAFVLFVAIFGGLALLGTWGFILGPLVARLTMEALDLWRETPPPTPPE